MRTPIRPGRELRPAVVVEGLRGAILVGVGRGETVVRDRGREDDLPYSELLGNPADVPRPPKFTSSYSEAGSVHVGAGPRLGVSRALRLVGDADVLACLKQLSGKLASDEAGAADDGDGALLGKIDQGTLGSRRTSVGK